ncbi:DEAD/DEAH box helicase family protein [Candidatus Manganitrophus noduliformans]|nr:DEAD/DEAH box helicase family protein [Candidatus Manganitrophus noduliformans]
MKKLTLSRFLENYKEAIRGHVIDQFRPLYTPADRKEYADRLSTLKRKPFAAQIDAIAGLTMALRRQRAAFLVGEMGVGKTAVSIAVAYLLGMKNVLVLCPPHLVQKWEKEIKMTLPCCEVIQVRSITGLCKSYQNPASKPRFFILSRERAKLSYRWKPAVLSLKRILLVEEEGRTKRAALSILACPACFAEVKDRDGIPFSLDQLGRRKEKCLSCGGPLWEADRTGVRRYAIADFIKQKMKGCFELFIADELHELKAKGSAQGLAAAALAGSAKKVLALTGTLFGGYSTTLFHLLYRFTPEVKKAFRHNDEGRWASRYGILERITKFEEGHSEDGAVSRRRRYHTRVVERPGISPEVIFHLIDKGVFLRLSDLSVRLPLYQEEVLLSEMEPAQKEAYKRLALDLIQALKEQLASGNKSLLGIYLQALLSYPDQPFRGETVIDKETGEIVARAPALPEEMIYPKEHRLIDLVRKELSQCRKVLLYVTHTERRDITGRLERLLTTEGFSVSVLKSHTVSPEQREGWIAEKLRGGLQVLISQPRNVSTGLDLIDFPTILFYEPEYSVYTLRQAGRRSWRIGQHHPVKVYFMAYQETLQEKGLRLIAAKVRSALAVEGELVDAGLSSFQEDQDFFLQLARSIVGEEEVPEGGFEEGIAHPLDWDQPFDPDALPEEMQAPIPVAAAMPEQDGTGHQNGTGINGNSMKVTPLPSEVPVAPPVPCLVPARQAPLFTGVENPEQLALF